MVFSVKGVHIMTLKGLYEATGLSHLHFWWPNGPFSHTPSRPCLKGHGRHPLGSIRPLVVHDCTRCFRAVGEICRRRAGGNDVALLWASVDL